MRLKKQPVSQPEKQIEEQYEILSQELNQIMYSNEPTDYDRPDLAHLFGQLLSLEAILLKRNKSKTRKHSLVFVPAL